MIDPFAALDRGVESDLEARFVRYITHKFPTARIRKGGWPGRRGAADRVVLMPGAFIAFAELKNGTSGRVSGNQAVEIRELQDLGFVAAVLRTDADIATFARLIERRTLL